MFSKLRHRLQRNALSISARLHQLGIIHCSSSFSSTYANVLLVWYAFLTLRHICLFVCARNRLYPGKTALEVAVRGNHVDCANVLREAGAT